MTDDWERVKLDAANESRTICDNCEKDLGTHVDLKCLFEPTYFQAMSIERWINWRSSKLMKTYTYRWTVDT